MIDRFDFELQMANRKFLKDLEKFLKINRPPKEFDIPISPPKIFEDTPLHTTSTFLKRNSTNIADEIAY
ncbi:hypothetical protein AA106556_1907 [Neokomagataea tanensis NBRC 106556]|uniref:Uncharacterized protein n=1 Tax=Neokomagataea tanensis NBRC 106556 TaxID=1223519 RepID=A0ABQ0QL88_9PROT|nr:hypothetical protein AA106556_1907 [Neokomagataea tanensis NBRC 106556]